MAVYVCDIIGDGSADNSFRPAIDDHIKGWSAIDGREDVTIAVGSMLVFCNPTEAEAAVIAADPRNEQIA
jgi:hypothetical protein